MPSLNKLTSPIGTLYNRLYIIFFSFSITISIHNIIRNRESLPREVHHPSQSADKKTLIGYLKYWEEKKLGSYMKYNKFYWEKKKKKRENLYLAENLSTVIIQTYIA